MKKAKTSAGFTLIEIMIVLAILGGVIALGMPRLVRNSEQNFNSTLRHMIVLSREVRNKARVSKSTYRIAIQMDDEEGHGYWVERASGRVLIQNSENESRGIRRRQDDEEEASPFQPDERVMKEKRFLPDGFRFTGVENSAGDNRDKLVAYLYYFPEGLVDESVVHITNQRGYEWTLAIHPLTGKIDIIEEKVSLDQLRK